ncbi:uncharacterized protein LOC112514320 [Cynara cardunculus var. scolymus]|uniref:uncharacterized protein LOC112514320 n=1 Tax=Cynara cardunculus var. scolymus TaxID=59895 RepID=UPI000D62ABC1|nr:uncharacterized protein LOC112514320 [Cynara cardunculus var. scolymus]XP_024976498.1 uncharacterized protein LOC112514320 [Cynara cardunculus var. scolymus]
MVQKRQLAEEEYDASPKHLKLENSCQLVSCLEFPSKDGPVKSCISGISEDPFMEETSESERRFESGKILDLPVCTEKDVGYSHLLRFPPLKEVPIGPEYQAVIPEWCGYDANNISFRSGSSKTSAFCQTSEANSIYDENKFMGSCIVSIHETDGTVCNDDAVGRGRTGCCCEDPDSLRCVRQHIREAREKIRRNIGHERFLELGFCSMGDVVACKWTEEDEQLFHEVVYSNPVSLGKNFWVHLAEAFPSRTNQEIVSYYFNVFVLQRRAEQNRCDPMNADSDDDEWQGSDQDENLCRDEIEKYGFSIGNPVFDYNEDMGFLHGFRGSINFSETQASMVDENGGDCDFQDDSCTSSDTGVEPEASEVKVDCGKLWSNRDFILEPLDSKAWDVGCFSFPRNKTDFLSTGSMIEEVFGVESWNITVKDNKKGSS